MAGRSTLSIQANVVFAIFFHEIHRNFGEYKLGILWALLEPVLMLLVFVLLFGLKGRGEFGFVEPPLFILAAFLPFRSIFHTTMKSCMSADKALRSLSNFRQISLFDIVFARTVISFLVGVTAGLVIAVGMYWIIGLNPLPDRILEVLVAIFTMSLFAMATGLVFCLIQDVAKEIGKIVDFMTMPLLFLSAVFYPMTAIPEPYRSLLALNPLVHPMEIIREYWFVRYESPVADPQYWASWIIGSLFLAMMLYRLRWRKVIAK